MKKKITNLKNKDDDISYTYDQTIDGVTYFWCWFIHTWTACSTLWNYRLSLQEQLRFIYQLLDRGYDRTRGYSLEMGMELINELRNRKFPNMPIKCWMGKFNTPEMRVHLNLGKPVGLQLKTGPKYRKDREDEILQEILYRPNDIESAHAIVYKFFHDVKKFYFVDTRLDGKRYEASRQYITTVKNLIGRQEILFFDKA